MIAFGPGLCRIISLGLVVLLGFIPLASAQQADAGLAQLQTEIGRLAQSAGGTTGVAVSHIESGREVRLNPGQRYPMGSTFKVPIALQLLMLVEKGSVSLDRVITLRPGDLRPGSGTLVKQFDAAQPERTVRELLELMMIVSDNSATDVLWKEAGGAEAIMSRLRSLRVDGISVDRPTSLLIAASWGIDPPPPDSDATPERFAQLGRSISRRQREDAQIAMAKDPRDSATPEAMLDILLKIWRREALNPESSALLLDIMVRCESGRGRLKGLLPRGTKVAHKTGTLNGIATNDVGIITLPRGAGHAAIAVMVKESANGSQVQERAIAEIARAVYDYFSTNQ